MSKQTSLELADLGPRGKPTPVAVSSLTQDAVGSQTLVKGNVKERSPRLQPTRACLTPMEHNCHISNLSSKCPFGGTRAKLGGGYFGLQ